LNLLTIDGAEVNFFGLTEEKHRSCLLLLLLLLHFHGKGIGFIWFLVLLSSSNGKVAFLGIYGLRGEKSCENDGFGCY
jgi:hypothetical protein